MWVKEVWKRIKGKETGRKKQKEMVVRKRWKEEEGRSRAPHFR